MVCDVLVVGGGPAGLSAATWAARYRRSVLVVDSGEYRNSSVEQSHGYLGCDPGDPMGLLRDARRDLGRYPNVTFRAGTATGARRERDRFVVTVDGEECEGLRLVLATGVRDRFPDVERFFEHYGRSVFHCATCDGYEAQDRSVAVLGWSEQVAAFAVGLLDWCRDLTVLTDGRRFEGDDAHRALLARHGIPLLEVEAVALEGPRGDLRGVRLGDGSILAADLVFFSIGHDPRLELARQLGAEVNDEGCLVVDRDGLTSVDGCYAAGDVTPGYQLVVVAAGKGATAGVACATSLQGEQGAPNAPTPAPDAAAELAGSS